MEPDIIETRRAGVRHLTLNRPQALNALTLDMVKQFSRCLAEYEADPVVTLIIVDAMGDKAFCAGGDVARLYNEARGGNPDFCLDFWSALYALVSQIAALKTPYVALMKGIVMGGGVGIGSHGRHRIVSDRTLLAMPECSIGLVPDVGVSHLLAQAPFGAAEYVAQTGARLDAAGAIALDFADHFVPSDRHAALVSAMVDAGSAEPIARFATEPPTDVVSTLADGAVRAFEGTVDTLNDRLDAHNAPWAAKAATALRSASPLSLALTRHLLNEARAAPGVDRALERELGAVRHCLLAGDFLEGVRAAIIDKDRQPQWQTFSGELPAIPVLPVGHPAAAMPRA